MARVPLQPEGLAQVVDWWQVQEYAPVTNFVWLRRMNPKPDDPKKEVGKGMCPCHRVWIVRTNPCTNQLSQ